MSRVARNVTVVFAQQLLGALGGAVGFFFVARHMDRAVFAIGVLQFALATGAMFAFILRAFDLAHVKRLSEGRDEARCNGTFLLLKTLAALAYVGMMEGGILLWTTILPAVSDGALGGRFQTPMHAVALQLIIVYYLLNGIGEVPRRTFEGRQNVVAGQVVLTTEHVVKTALMVYVALGGFGPLSLVATFVLGAGALALVAVAYAVRRPMGRPDRGLARSYAAFAKPTLAAAGLAAIGANVSVVLVQLFWGASEVGIYSAPMRYVQLLTALGTALSTALLPVISARHARGEGSAELVRRGMLVSLAVIGPVAALLLAIPHAVIHVVLSDRFLAAADVSRVLTVVGIIAALQLSVGTNLLGVNRPDVSTRLSALMLVVSLGIHLVLVPASLGGVPLVGGRALGAAFARLASSAIGFTIGAFVLYRVAHVKPPADLWRPVVALLASVAALRGLAVYVLPELQFRVWHLMGAGVLSVAVFWIALGLVRGITPEDRVLVRTLLHPAEWRRFLAREGRSPPRDGSDRL